MKKPKVYRHAHRRWYVNVPTLRYSVGPFISWEGAMVYAGWTGGGL